MIFGVVFMIRLMVSALTLLLVLGLFRSLRSGFWRGISVVICGDEATEVFEAWTVSFAFSGIRGEFELFEISFW